MHSPKVSVIIPVYNTAPYLHEALSSITRQTLQELEIIIVNDGSTDGSGEIIREVAETDGRIKVFEQENRGLSCARNAGIPLAAGEYVYFMDSDDKLELDALELCYQKCEEGDLDFVFFDAENMVVKQTDTPIQNYSRKGQIDESKIWEGKELLDFEIEHYLYRSPVWLYFVRRSYMVSFFQGFYPGIIHEDHLFTVPLYLNAKRAAYISRMFFKRRIRENSIMNSRFTMRNIKGYTVTVDGLLQLSMMHEEWNLTLHKFVAQMLNAVVWEAHRLTFNEKWRTFVLFLRKGWGKYIRLRMWLVFWLKK